MNPVLAGLLPLITTLTGLVLWGFLVAVFGVVMALRVARGDYPEPEEDEDW